MGLGNAFRKILGRGSARRGVVSDWPTMVTLESSFACNLSCPMCPRACGDFRSASGRSSAFLEPSVFGRVEPFFSRFRHVHLSIWGEPLLNPHIVDYVGRIVGRGADASLATNGTLLTEEMSRGLLGAGVYHINLSCDASTRETYGRVRGADLFDRVVENARVFCRLRDEMGSGARLRWVFVMLKSNLGDLAGAVELAGRCGADEFVAKHMETSADVGGLGDALFDTGRVAAPGAADQGRLEGALARAGEVARGFPGMDFAVHPQVDMGETTCLVMPLDLVMVDHEGNVSPCCYTMPVLTRPYQTETSQGDRELVLGNVCERGLDEILSSGAYRAFRGAWRCGHSPGVCRGCLILRRRSALPSA